MKEYRFQNYKAAQCPQTFKACGPQSQQGTRRPDYFKKAFFFVKTH